MNRQYHRWYSPRLNRDMELLVFGHSGARVIVFPTSQGRFYEWEDRGMMDAMSDFIDNGWFQFYCVDSVDAESWYNRWAHPEIRAQRNNQYDAYLLHEVVPLSRQLNPNPYLITTGASFGAYHAANFAFRNPWTVNRVVGMSGLYDIRRFTGGISGGTVYFNNPMEYIPNEQDWNRLEALKQMDIILVTGHGDPNVESSRRMSHELWQKGIWNALRVWDGWAHDWPWWKQMIRRYIGGHD